MDLSRVYIIGGARTPFVKSLGQFKSVTTQELMTASLKNLVEKFHLQSETIGDVAIGATIKNSLDWDLARECVLGSGLDAHTPAYGIQRACGSSLEAVIQMALKIANHQIETGIAGGVDTNSDLPLVASRKLTKKLVKFYSAKSFYEKMKILFSLRPSDIRFHTPSVKEPRTGLSMGEHCEKMVKEWNITRAEQDQFALRSHQNAINAYKEDFYDDLVFQFHHVKHDTIPRADTTLEKLARLKPSFDLTGTGTLTAGNSTPLTDGSAAVLLASEAAANTHQWVKQARFVDGQVAAVDFVHGEGLLMAPTIAVAKLLERNHLSLQDFDFYEIHEAFEGQVLCTLRAFESAEYCERVLHRAPLGSIDLAKLNIKGGSVALGHPFAASGARIVASLAKMLYLNKKGRGLISICTAGGMGVAVILEAV